VTIWWHWHYAYVGRPTRNDWWLEWWWACFYWWNSITITILRQQWCRHSVFRLPSEIQVWFIETTLPFHSIHCPLLWQFYDHSFKTKFSLMHCSRYNFWPYGSDIIHSCASLACRHPLFWYSVMLLLCWATSDIDEMRDEMVKHCFTARYARWRIHSVWKMSPISVIGKCNPVSDQAINDQ